MEAPKLPPFAGEIVNFDRRGTRVVACVDASKVASSPRMGPDGKPVDPPAPKPSEPPRLRIWVLEREIMQELLTTSGLCDPSWSPDGKSFVAAGVRGVFVFTEPNFEPRVLVAGQLQAPPPGAQPARQFDDPVWSPNGARVAFRTSGPGAGDARVEVVDVKSAEVLLKHEGAAKALRWADDRTLIVDQARVPLP
jgi:Tol biopolymer transport system component